MRVLYRDPSDGSLTVTEVTSITYYPEEGILEFAGDEDFGVRADRAAAEKLVRSLYLEGRLDVSGYDICEVDDDFDDEDDDEDDEDELDDAIDAFLNDEEDEDGFRLPHRIAFPRRERD